MRKGIHRPDPNPSWLQVSHRFLTARSQVSHRFFTGFSQASHRFLTAFLTDPEQPDFISHRFLTEPAHRFLTGKNDLIIPNDSTPSSVTNVEFRV